MGHPAHVHFFRNAIKELHTRGHEVKVTARDKDVTLALLDAYGLECEVRPSGWRPLNLIQTTGFIKKRAREFKADKLAGVHNPYIAGAAKSLKKPCILFTDTPGSKMVNRLSVDRASKVVTPDCLAGMFEHQVTYPGYKEMAYLHPKYFKPDKSVLARHGINENEPFFVVRFIEWSAYHDSGVKGLSDTEKANLVKHLSKKRKVVASVEGNQKKPPGTIPVTKPEDVHSLLALSSGYVGEGATMAKEAAIMGIPTVYISPFQNLPPINELSKNKQLTSMEKNDTDSIEQVLKTKPQQMDMSDLTSMILKYLGETN